MSGGGRMNYEALGVADVGQMGEQLDRIDEFSSCIESTFDAESQNTAKPTFEVFRGHRIIGVLWQARISDPSYEWVFLQEFGNGESVLRVTFLSQWQRFQALQELEGI